MISSIRFRILFACLATLVLALAVTATVGYRLTAYYGEVTIEQNLRTVSLESAQAISKWVSDSTRILSSIDERQIQGDLKVFLTQLRSSGGFTTAFVAYPDKTLVSTSNFDRTSDRGSVDPTTRPYYMEAVRSRHLIMTEPYAGQLSQDLRVTFSRPIMVGDTLKCVIGTVISLSAVSAGISQIHPTKSSFAFVVGGDGRIIAHPDSQLDLRAATELDPKLTGDLLSRLRSSHTPKEILIRGAEKLLYAQEIAGTGWTLIVALDDDEAKVGLRAMVRAQIVSSAVLALIATLLLAVLTAGPFRRLMQARNAMYEIAAGNGDLTKKLDDEGNDEVSQIARSFNLFVQKLNLILCDIRQRSEDMLQIANEISQGNRSLSERTEEAASSLQQTAASMEQICITVSQSEGLAIEANIAADCASQLALHGGSVVADAASTMASISDSSKRIADIIGVIDGITAQTNILALNAAVEAARAKEHGRGFAVVAGEVRVLAQRCAHAASEIKQLVDGSAVTINEGVDLASAAKTSMDETVQRVRAVSTLVTRISVAAREQSDGIGQVNRAVQQLDDMTQQNAALVEESSAIADLLKEHAIELSGLIAEFRLTENAQE